MESESCGFIYICIHFSFWHKSSFFFSSNIQDDINPPFLYQILCPSLHLDVVISISIVSLKYKWGKDTNTKNPSENEQPTCGLQRAAAPGVTTPLVELLWVARVVPGVRHTGIILGRQRNTWIEVLWDTVRSFSGGIPLSRSGVCGALAGVLRGGRSSRWVDRTCHVFCLWQSSNFYGKEVKDLSLANKSYFRGSSQVISH